MNGDAIGLKDLFNPNGRINRASYFTGGALLSMFALCAGFALGMLFSIIGKSLPAYTLELCQLLVALPLVYGQFCVTSKRLHDLNLPALLSLIAFAGLIFQIAVALTPNAYFPAAVTAYMPLAGNIILGTVIIFVLGLLFVPGTKGPNRYGQNVLGAKSPPRPNVLEG